MSQPLSSFHQPVMCAEVVTALVTNPDGLYIDLTFGGGGHSRALLEKLSPKGRLIAFDQDRAAASQAALLDDSRLHFIQASFRFASPFLAALDRDGADGILADLGVSSHQIDTAERGFSTRLDGPLDMRMDPDTMGTTASELLATISEKELTQLLRTYGELRNAPRLAASLVSARKREPIRTTRQLRDLALPFAPPGRQNKYAAKVFQSLRIYLNDEVGALEELLPQLPDMLRPGGRVAILSYHSLEDRRVKVFFRSGNTEDVQEKDLYGHVIQSLVPLHRKPMMSSDEEIAQNNRARSARLRVAVKT